MAMPPGVAAAAIVIHRFIAWLASGMKTAATGFFVLCFFFLLAPRVFSLPMMGANTEPRIDRIINSNADRFPLPGNWKMARWHYTDLDIFIYLEKSHEKKTLVRLACSSLPTGSLLAGKSLNFRVEVVSFSGVEEKEAILVARALFERINHNEPAMFFDYPDMKNREGMSELIFRKYLFLPLLICGLACSAVLLILCFRTIQKYLMPSGIVCTALLMCLIAGGAALRFAAGPRAPVHNNGHGVRELRGLLFLESPEQKEIKYGRTYITLMGGLAGAAGGTDNAVFILNEIFGSLAILCMYMLARALLQSEAAALCAAAAFCFSPALVWLSGSESPASMHLFFALAGFAFTAVAARHRNVPLLWLACIFICLAASMRMLTILAAPAAALIFMFSSFFPPACPRQAGVDNRSDPFSHKTFQKHLLLCLGMIILWIVFHWLSLDPENAGKGFARFSPVTFLYNMRTYNILFDPTLTPVCLPAFAAAGFLVVLWKRPLLALTMATLFVLLVPVSFTTMADRTDFVRYQPQAYWLYFLFTGVFTDYLIKLPRPRWAAFAAAVSIPIAMGLFSIPGLRFLASGNEEIAEYHFLARTASEFKPGSRIALPSGRQAGNGRLSSEFPDYLGKFQILRAGARSDGSDVIYYLGLDCYRYDDIMEMKQKSARGGMTRECASVCGSRAIPIKTEMLNASIPQGLFHRRYFLLGSHNPVIGFYKCPRHTD